MNRSILNICLIDDDAEDRNFFCEAMEELSLKTFVREFSSAASFMTNLLSGEVSQIDVIFLDLRMPVQDGLECLRDIRQLEQWSTIPIIMYSTTSQLIEINQLKERGATIYFEKPSSYKQLKFQLTKCLRFVIGNAETVEQDNSGFVILN